MISRATRSHLSELIAEHCQQTTEPLFAAADLDHPDVFPGPVFVRDMFRYITSLDEESVLKLVGAVARSRRMIRTRSQPKYVFDDRWSLLENALRIDGYALDNSGGLYATETLPVTNLVSKDHINAVLSRLSTGTRESIERVLADAESSLADIRYETLNGAISLFRTALETAYRECAAEYTGDHARDEPPRWGDALRLLRENHVISEAEERAVSAHYTLMSQFHGELLSDRRDELAFHRGISIFWILFIVVRAFGGD